VSCTFEGLNRAEIRKIILELIKTDEEFRLIIASAIGFESILNELKKLREDFNNMIKRVESIELTLHEHTRILQEHTRLLQEHSRTF